MAIMTLKKTMLGMTASFAISVIAGILSLVPIAYLSGGAWCPLTGFEYTACFEWMQAVLSGVLTYSQLCMIIMLFFTGMSAAFAWLFIRRYTSNGATAVTAAMLYAFCGAMLTAAGTGWIAVAAFMPLLLWGMDSFYIDGRSGRLAAGAGLTLFFMRDTALIPMFFIAALVYFICRLNVYRKEIKVLALGMLEWLAAFAAAGLPLVFEDASLFAGFTISGAGVFEFFQKWLFPPMLEAKQGSFSLWLPLMGWSGIFAVIQGKNHPLRGVGIFGIIMFAISLLLSVMGIMPQSLGAVVFLPNLAAAVCAASALDGDGRILQKSYAAVMFFTAVMCVLNAAAYTMGYINAQPQALAWLIGGAAVSCACGIAVMVLRAKKRLVLFLGAVVCIGTAASSYVQSWGALPQVAEYGPYTAASINSFLDNDHSRAEFPKGKAWIAKYWNIPSFAVGGEEKDLAMRNALELFGANEAENNFAVHSLMSARWKFVNQDEDADMVGYKYYGDLGSWKVYQNLYSLPFGVMYDYYLPYEDFYNAPKENRAKLALKGIVISDEDYETVKEYIDKLPKGTMNKLSDKDSMLDCYNLSQSAVSAIEFEENGFTAFSEFEYSGVVFFSVPYKENLKCTIDGEDTPVFKANGEFVAMVVPAGEREIIVTAENEFAGAKKYASMVGAAIIILLLILDIVKNKNSGRKSTQFVPNQENKEEIKKAKPPKKSKEEKPNSVQELLAIPNDLDVTDDLLGEPLVSVTEKDKPKIEPVAQQQMPKAAEQEKQPQAEVPKQVNVFAKSSPQPQKQEAKTENKQSQPNRTMTVDEMQADIMRRKQRQREELEKLLGKKEK